MGRGRLTTRIMGGVFVLRSALVRAGQMSNGHLAPLLRGNKFLTEIRRYTYWYMGFCTGSNGKCRQEESNEQDI